MRKTGRRLKRRREKRGDKPSRFEEYAKQSTRNIEMAEAARKRKSISELANTSVEGNISAGNKKKDTNKDSANDSAASSIVAKAPVKDDDDSDSSKKKSGKKGDTGSSNIAAYANMLKKK